MARYQNALQPSFQLIFFSSLQAIELSRMHAFIDLILDGADVVAGVRVFCAGWSSVSGYSNNSGHSPPAHGVIIWPNGMSPSEARNISSRAKRHNRVPTGGSPQRAAAGRSGRFEPPTSRNHLYGELRRPGAFGSAANPIVPAIGVAPFHLRLVVSMNRPGANRGVVF